MALEVLRCAACGAPVALDDADDATCGQCGTRTQIPAEHRALRDASGWDAQTRRAAEAALHTFDTPPGLFMRIVAWFTGWPFAAVFVLFSLPLLLLDIGVAFVLSSLLCRLLGLPYDGVDVIPLDMMSIMMGVVLWFMTVVPAYLAAYGGRRVTARQVLLAALAARPPSYPGGPACCRSCGAPLTVEQDALVARCLYCRAENAVRLSAQDLSSRHDSTTKLADDADDDADLELAPFTFEFDAAGFLASLPEIDGELPTTTVPHHPRAGPERYHPVDERADRLGRRPGGLGAHAQPQAPSGPPVREAGGPKQRCGEHVTRGPAVREGP